MLFRSRMEAAWADARSGGTKGLFVLVTMCRDPHASTVAQSFLTELGRESAIPKEATEPNFVAMAAMSTWLQHPNEMGRQPDELSLFDTREIFWPPTDDRRQVWLVAYSYRPSLNDGDDEPVSGLGMVGSVTFALFGEATAGLSAEDAYALYCCWELEMREDPRAPEKRSVAEGRRLLGF